MGVNTGDLGIHIYSKGEAPIVSAVCTVSPPIKSLCIRCGLSMGGVKERYIKYESARYQYAGHCDSSLDQKSKLLA